MTAPRDPDLLIRAFLAEGQAELPDRAYDAVRQSVDRTRQRVVVGPWREPRMSTVARVAIAAAAVLVAAIVGFRLAPSSNVVSPGPSSPTPTASPSTSPRPSASASAGPLAYAWPRTLAPGSYSTSLSWDPFYVFRFTVPKGWESRDIEIIKSDRMALQFYFVDNVVVDTCTETLKNPPIEKFPGAVSTALSKLVKLTAGPRTTTVGDREGTYVEFTVGPDFGCAPSEFRLFKLRPGTCGEGCGGLGPPWKGLEFGGVQEHNRMWILTVGRGHVVINAVWTSKATAADLAELQEVIDSMRADTPNATEPPHPESISP
ncbi:MAG TPA: hypothetical protein VFY18_08050 [Candidatus Limnocylindrales bacterium]|nr:hypothetical protein [Candidatus Limnocylindrales bacterium]